MRKKVRDEGRKRNSEIGANESGKREREVRELGGDKKRERKRGKERGKRVERESNR